MAEKYNEIFRLKEMLEKAKIPFVFRNCYDGYQICYPKNNDPYACEKGIFDRVCSVIEHEGSYGHGRDELEIMGLLTSEEAMNDEVVGYLTAEDVFQRIENHYKGTL